MKKILIIGGTGTIGQATVKKSLRAGFDVTTIGLEHNPNIPDEVHQVLVDKNNQAEYEKTASELNQNNQWDIVFDVYNLGIEDAKHTYNFFKNNTKHFFIISTTLVYDRSWPYKDPIKSSHLLAQIGTMGGYADHKLELENFWHKITDKPWTILRPYHIVGPGCLLGCIPDENRDPELLNKIKNNITLNLCEEGNIQFNYIHPNDIAEIVIRAANNPATFYKAYNTVNPAVITAKDYYGIIANKLGTTLSISNKPISQIWKESEGWELTTLPHIYDTSDLQSDISFTPSTPLETAIQEAIDNYPEGNKQKSEIAIHKRMTMLPRPKPIDWLLKS